MHKSILQNFFLTFLSRFQISKTSSAAHVAVADETGKNLAPKVENVTKCDNDVTLCDNVGENVAKEDDENSSTESVEALSENRTENKGEEIQEDSDSCSNEVRL